MVSLKSRKMFTFRMGHVKIFPNICMNFMLLSKVKSGRYMCIYIYEFKVGMNSFFFFFDI
ncbi:hypothetical protein Hanom_Chr07g00656071 [Helianthus anomalus]